MKIDWHSLDSLALINPCYSEQERQRFIQIPVLADLKSHIWLSTSGSTAMKWVGLSKEAILMSAQAVNQHLDSHSQDRWIQTLPYFHVGGLGIWARSYLSGAKVFDFKTFMPKWDALTFHQFVEQHQGSLTSLVPAQVHDLVQLNLQAPASLRAVIVGGGALLPTLYHQAIKLGWKLLPSYGLTECASQVATAELDSWKSLQIYPSLKKLSHLEIEQDSTKKLRFKGNSLLSVYARWDNKTWILKNPKIDGWFVSEDRGEIQQNYLRVDGRADQVIKIGGENVDVFQLEQTLQEICLTFKIKQEMTLVAIPDHRLGFVIHLAIVGNCCKDSTTVIQAFNQKVLPFEKIRDVQIVPYIPKTALGKINRFELLKTIQKGLYK